ncbi:putative phage tape measure protein [Acaryochloris phage A-HIS2]|nr:putative phage tape measure protein [Acaryochloris phage A-HIS2]
MAESVYKIITQLAGDTDVQNGLNKIAVAAGLTGAALTALSKTALDAANDVERSLGNLGTLLDNPEEEIEVFRAGIDELSDSLKNTVSINKLAAESYNVVSAGFSDSADALVVLERAQKLALVGQGSLEASSDGLTTALNALSDTFDEGATVAENSDRVVGAFAETIRLGKTNIDQLGPALAQVAPQANALNINVETLGASFATLTANGVKTKEASTQLRALLRALTTQTPLAQREMQRLGLSFDENTVRSQGLAATLKQIAEATNGSSNSLNKLLGSSEAVAGFTTLAKGNFDRLDASLEALGDEAVRSADKLNESFDALSENRAVKAERALNKLNDTLVTLGQGVAVAVEPAIDAVAFLLENFDALPEPVKQAIGVITALSAVGLTAGAALVAVAVAVNQVNGALALMAPKVAATATALKAKAVAAKAAAVSTVSLNASLLTIVGTLGLAAAAVGTLAIGWKNLQDRQKEAAEFAKTEDLLNTQSLADDLEKLTLEIRKTGKAIPDEKLKIFTEAAKKAANETNQLGTFVKILEKEQKKAKTAIDESTKANIENAETEEDRTEKIKDYVKETEAAISASENRFNIERDALEESLRSQGKTESEILEARSQANQAFYAEQANLRRQQLDSSLIDGEERERIELELVKVNTQAARDIRETKKKTSEIIKQESEKAAAAEKKAAEEARAARKKATDEAIQDTQRLTQALRGSAEAQAAAVQNAAELNRGNSQFLSSTKGLLNDIAKSVQDETVSSGTRNKLLGISRGLLGDLRDLGFDISGNLKTEAGLLQLNATLQQAEFRSKLEEINLKRQEIALEKQLQTLTEQGKIAEARVKLENQDITESERKQLELQVKLSEKRLGILEQQERVAQRNLDLQEKTVRAQSQITAAQANESLEGSPVRSASSQVSSSLPEGSSDTIVDTSGIETELSNVTLETSNVVSGVQEVQNRLDILSQTSEALRLNLEGILEATRLVTDNQVLIGENQGLILQEAQRQSGILESLRNDVFNLQLANENGIQALNSTVSRLPGQIAALIPRPSND